MFNVIEEIQVNRSTWHYNHSSKHPKAIWSDCNIKLMNLILYFILFILQKGSHESGQRIEGKDEPTSAEANHEAARTIFVL